MAHMGSLPSLEVEQVSWQLGAIKWGVLPACPLMLTIGLIYAPAISKGEASTLEDRENLFSLRYTKLRSLWFLVLTPWIQRENLISWRTNFKDDFYWYREKAQRAIKEPWQKAGLWNLILEEAHRARTPSIFMSWTFRGLRPEYSQVSMRLAGSLDLFKLSQGRGHMLHACSPGLKGK